MSGRNYPRFGEDRKLQRGPKPCVISTCELAAEREAHIQFDWFRGEDGVYPVCWHHLGLARNRLAEFLKLPMREGMVG